MEGHTIGGTLSVLLRSRATSLGLVAALGFLLLASLVISAFLTTLSNYIHAMLPGGHIVLQVLKFLAPFALITILFAAIYKVLPDRRIEWCDVLVLYLGSSTAASSYGAAVACQSVLLWAYYSAQIFLSGAEFTKVFAHRHGSRA